MFILYCLFAGLIRSKQSTYITITADTTHDLAGNELIPYVDGKALPCDTYISDTVSPYVIKSTLNMNSGVLSLTMSEPVVLATVDVTKLTVQLSIYNASTSYALTSPSLVTQYVPLSLLVEIVLCAADLNTMKYRYPLSSDIAHSFYSFTPLFLTDTSLNKIAAVAQSTPLAVTTYIADVTRPEVVTYVCDMNDQVIILTFSESVRNVSIAVGECQFVFFCV